MKMPVCTPEASANIQRVLDMALMAAFCFGCESHHVLIFCHWPEDRQVRELELAATQKLEFAGIVALCSHEFSKGFFESAALPGLVSERACVAAEKTFAHASVLEYAQTCALVSAAGRVN